jgi:hypothetical protein
MARTSSTAWRHCRRRKYVAALGVVLCAAGLLRSADPVRVPERYRAGDPLPLSLQNEVDAAIARAGAWLAHAQQPDGSWAGSNRVALTAAAGLALTGLQVPAADRAAVRAAAWLDSRPAPEADREALGWRATWRGATNPAVRRALQAALVLSGPSPTNVLARLAAALALSTDAVDRAALSATVVGVSNLSLRCGLFTRVADVAGEPSATVRAAAAELAVRWSRGGGPPIEPALGANRQRWLVARFVNRTLGGVLAQTPEEGRPAAVVDWRADLARALVECQRVPAEPVGGGFWMGNPSCADWAASDTAETVFAILALREL